MNFEIAPKSTEIKATWDEARMYCFSIIIDGKVGWRLPTKDELNEIYESENDFTLYWYWSSSEYSGSHIWVQYFHNGNVCLVLLETTGTTLEPLEQSLNQLIFFAKLKPKR
jgi:hypothetical protein